MTSELAGAKIAFEQQPEPVPVATQLAALPFLAGVDGYLRGEHPMVDLRITLHRVMSREGDEYLQQICDYWGSPDFVDTELRLVWQD